MTLIPTRSERSSLREQSSRNIKSLTKRLILQLPGFSQHRNRTLPQLRQLLSTKLTELGINRRGVKVRDYIDAYNQREKQTDDELFTNISRNKQARKKKQHEQEQYRQHLRDTAYEERQYMNINPYYQDTKTLESSIGNA